jgi:hypothetical protein
MRGMQTPGDQHHPERDSAAAYEAPAIDTRESLSDPLIGLVASGGMGPTG